ncbi:uncharacterized protein L203_104685 [Cryptococcus depauperatus CBS 7841]|uniref:Uncharacterized protein n=1 Tax=Cryptococcus depauperatus CBS 7841 TaxID=1295531 RepID=A0A1E3IN79_9TREE|nr:endoplasmic reticulum protein [Cryptococcus depauperatus CBS 7841]
MSNKQAPFTRPSASEPLTATQVESESNETARSRAGTAGSALSSRTVGNSKSSNGMNTYEPSKAGESPLPEAKMTHDLDPAKGRASDTLATKKPMKKFAYGFWSPEMAAFRKIAFKILISTVVITIIVVWLCLPLYWGSLWKSNRYTDKLTARIIDRDGGQVGQTITQGLLSHKNLRYFITSPSEFPTSADVEHDIVQEGAWGAIVINSGISDGLLRARQNGDASWNGSRAIDVYYAQARQETAVNSYLVPYLQQALGQLSAEYGTKSVAQYLQANVNNATAINLLAQAPTTLSNSIYYTMNNIRPYNQPVATAITLVGLIYMLILSFIMTMTNNAVREIISPFLTTRSYIMYRIISPICLYFPVSFFFTMVNLPFKVHFGAHYTYAGGFFLWWFTIFLGMGAVGLSTEAAITVLGPRFMAFFLIPLIIVNVSVASLPHELQPWVFRYGVAMPFYNCGRIVRTIIFNTKNDIAENMGILLAWIILNFITISIGTWWFRRKAVNQHNKEVAENEMDLDQP